MGAELTTASTVLAQSLDGRAHSRFRRICSERISMTLDILRIARRTRRYLCHHSPNRRWRLACSGKDSPFAVSLSLAYHDGTCAAMSSLGPTCGGVKPIGGDATGVAAITGGCI